MTVLHRYSSGHEEIHATSRVSFQPLQPEVGGDAETVFWERPDGTTVPITDGQVFVMNDLGKTVAKYRLNEHLLIKDTCAIPPKRHPIDGEEKSPRC